jgi:hypothetical protein
MIVIVMVTLVDTGGQVTMQKNQTAFHASDISCCMKSTQTYLDTYSRPVTPTFIKNTYVWLKVLQAEAHTV